MESLDELSKSSNGKPGFFKHVFNFNEDSKSEMLNIVQYAVLAIIPVVILNKLMQRFVPEADEEKGSVEISAEVLGQIVVMFLVLLLIHRIITFVPTYSGEKYADFSVTNIILAMLVIILSLQTKLGEKVSILVDRIVELWEGRGKEKDKKKKKAQAQQQQAQGQQQGQMMTMGSTSITALPPIQQQGPQQQQPDYNQMYQQDSTPLIGASTPGYTEPFEPMAANAGMGGAFGSSSGW